MKKTYPIDALVAHASDTVAQELLRRISESNPEVLQEAAKNGDLSNLITAMNEWHTAAQDVPHPKSHSFSAKAWRMKNPQASPEEEQAVTEMAQKEGYSVIP